MANPEHLEVIKKGATAWNKWRREHREVRPDLRYTDFDKLDFSYTDMSYTDLSKTDLSYVNLSNARLFKADLSYADLSYADLSYADLSYTNLSHATLSGADFTKCVLLSTIFGDINLSEAIALDGSRHLAPSIIDIDTIYKSRGLIPEVFLRGCGVHESFIVQMRSLVASTEAIQFYSCFISYSSTDQEFADRFHADLQAQGVRVWFAPHDMKIGARIRPTIDESIRVYDKLLLVLSEASVSSQWVEQEVETALAREREQEGKTVLFPIRLDDTVMESKAGWPALLKNTRNVGDFTCWKNHDSYQKAFNRLLRDLKAEA